MNKKNITIICGPTASGKSAFALKYALDNNGVIINADAFQVYKGLEVITASPTEEDKQLVPHKLYNYVSLYEQYTVIRYLKEVHSVIKDVIYKDKLPIIVGGNGLYIKSLLDGINTIPDVSIEVKQYSMKKLNMKGLEAIYIILKKHFPMIDNYIDKYNPNRLMRVYQLWLQTGLPQWHYYSKQKKYGIRHNYKVELIKILPQDKTILYTKARKRIDQFIDMNAIKEGRKVYDIYFKQNHNLHNSCKDIILLRELIEYFKKKITLEQAIEMAHRRNKIYIRTQYNWFKNHI